MTVPDEHQGVPEQEDVAENYSFDDVARGLASGGISRGRALKLAGAAVMGGALSIFALQDTAEAKKKKKKKRRRRGGGGAPISFCAAGSNVCVSTAGGQAGQVTCCPQGTSCCPGPLGASCCANDNLLSACIIGISVCAPGCLPEINVGGLVSVGDPCP